MEETEFADARGAGPSTFSRRSLLRVGLTTGGLALGGGGLLTACGGGSTPKAASSPGAVSKTLAKMRSSGATIGLADAPPYSSLNKDGTVTGLGPDVTVAVLKLMGVTKVKGVVGTYATMVPGMQAGRWQMIGAVLQLTKARCGQVLFADPINVDGASWCYLPDYVNPPTTLKGAPKNIKIGLLTGAYLIPLAQAAGFSNSNIVQFPDRPSLIAGLKAKRCELALNTTIASQQLATQEKNTFKVTPNLSDVPNNGSSVAVSSEDTAFYSEFQSALASLRASGGLLKIQSKYGFSPDSGADKDLTAQVACANATS
jgi:polar amino acid transport system substrate-binding protein